MYARAAEDEDADCNTALFEDGGVGNGIVWLITRSITALSADVCCLYLFYKKWKGKEHERLKRKSTMAKLSETFNSIYTIR